MNSTIPFLPDVRSRPSFHPSSPRDWLIVQAPLAILTLATRLALEPKPNPIAQATRFLLLPLGIYSVLVVCTSRDYSSGIPALNAYNYGIGLLGFVTAMKLIEVTFLKQPPKRVVALPRVTTPESDDTSSSGGNSKNGAKDCFREEVIPPSVSEAFAYLCDPRGISYDFGARAFQPPEWRDVNNRTTFLLSTLWRVILRSCAMDAIQVAFRMIPGTTIGSPQGGSIFIPSLPLPWRYVVSSAITIATGFCVYCGLNIGHDLITLFRVGVLGDDPSYYPPLFWRPWEAVSLRELWSKRWHALFRNHLTVLGWSIGSALLGNVGGVLGVFTLSGILHDWTIWGMGKGTDPWRIVGYFWLQGVAVILEDLWRRVTRKKVGGYWGRVWTIGFQTVTAHLVIEAWLQRGIGACRYPIFSPSRYLLEILGGLAPIVRHYATARQNLSNVALKPPNFGQPTPHTHPHLIFDDEVTPGIKKSEYEGRRRRLMEEIHVDDAVVVCLAAPVKYASGDIFYKYRQASDFWYLTGFQEPESALILEKLPSSSKGYRSTIFVRPKDPHRELWDGARTGVDAVQALLGVDQALPMDSFGIYLESVIGQSTQLYVSDPPRHDGSTTLGGRKKRAWSNFFTRPMSSTSQRPSYDELIKRAYDRRSSSVSPLAPRVLHMRAIKSEAEQRLMKAAGELSGTAHAKTMRFTEPDRSEADLAAHFEYLCALGGSERPAYVPVVASGANALMIHYTANDQIMKSGEMVLMDAGCELHGYASDITRTWPVSGTFTSPQRDLYQAVLNTLKSCTLLCTEDKGLSLYDIHRTSCELLSSELKQIGFNLGSGDLERLYPHFVSHPIGIDLHESGNSRGRSLVDGMVVTIEPGVYVPQDDSFPAAFRGIGIRLEASGLEVLVLFFAHSLTDLSCQDEVLVKKDHFVRLTANAPLEIVDVEGTCQGLLSVGPY